MANKSPAPTAPNGRQGGPGKKPRPLPPTKFQQHKEAVNRLQENTNKALLNSRAYFDAERLARVSPTILRQLEESSDEPTNEAKDNQPIAYGRPAYPDQQDPNDESNESGEQGQLAEEVQSSNDGSTTTGGRLANRAKKIMGDGGEKAKETLKAEAKKKAVQAAKKAAGKMATRALARFALMNPYVLGALAIIGGILILIIVAFVLIMAISGGGDVSASGSSATVGFGSTVRSVDISKLERVLDGNINTVEKAQEILAEVASAKIDLQNNPAALTILNDIETAAKAIIDDPSNAALVSIQADIIKQKGAALSRQLTNIFGDCAGVRCLDVEPIGQAASGHCGRAAVMMVVHFINKGVVNAEYNPNEHLIVRDGILLNKPGIKTCVSASFIDEKAPPGRGDWGRFSWSNAPTGDETQKKNYLLAAVQRSLAGGDPVVLSVKPGGTFDGKHFVTIIGYDVNDANSDGGTYIIHNPFPDGVHARTKYGNSSTARKLTGRHLHRYMGDAGNPHNSSIIIRKVYWDNPDLISL